MKLIIGGYAQGKNAYATTRFPAYLHLSERDYKLAWQIPSGNVPEDKQEERHSGVVINHLHRIIRELLDEGSTEDQIRALLLELKDKDYETVFIANEIGNGIVPMNPEDREWRDVTGRILVAIAAASDEVVRIYCGIPQVIKK